MSQCLDINADLRLPLAVPSRQWQQRLISADLIRTPFATRFVPSLFEEAFDCAASRLKPTVQFRDHRIPFIATPRAIPSWRRIALHNCEPYFGRMNARQLRAHSCDETEPLLRISPPCTLLLQSGDTFKVHPSPQTNSPFIHPHFDVIRQVVFPFWHNINLVMVVYKLFQELSVVVNG